jgi:hypothetical protein
MVFYDVTLTIFNLFTTTEIKYFNGMADSHISGKGWSQRVDLGTVGKIISDLLIKVCNAGLTISTRIVEHAAPKCVFSMESLCPQFSG